MILIINSNENWKFQFNVDLKRVECDSCQSERDDRKMPELIPIGIGFYKWKSFVRCGTTIDDAYIDGGQRTIVNGVD